MNLPIYLPVLLGVIGLISAASIYRWIIGQSKGTKKVQTIADKIHQGAMVFMQQEYSILAAIATFMAVCLYFALGEGTAIAFLVGAICSASAGFLGMYTATKANVRTTVAASKGGLSKALLIAFMSGSVMGLCVAALGLLGVGGLFIFYNTPDHIHHIHGFGMGASLVALFSRVGGGIFTKSADVGSDLVGKLEAKIPEDDPRNPGVIADNVGDNVGDIAGMGSDIFESYCGAIIATMAMASTFTLSELSELGSQSYLIKLPLLLACFGLVCSLCGIIMVKLNVTKAPNVALRFGTITASLCFIIGSYFLITWLPVSEKIWVAIVAGSVGGIIIGLVTEYYTSGKPIKKIAKSGETGPATVMISGIAIGMESVVVPLLTICGIIFVSTYFVGLYGVGIAAVGMLATVGMIMGIDAYGPVADNASGIAEMSGMGASVRKKTDALDAVGNTTAAIGKGFAIGAAALAALSIITAYVKVISQKIPDFTISLQEPIVLIGLLIGGILPYLIASMTMRAVGEAAGAMIVEIRRQFKQIKGLLQGKAEPDTERCIRIATIASLQKMIAPGALAVLAPCFVGFGLGPHALGGMLGGALLSCVLLALMMANSGGAWDNAKKYVETGKFGGKGSDVHAATVVGDTVGDPFKDTSGPSMNILINVMAIVSLVIAPLL